MTVRGKRAISPLIAAVLLVVVVVVLGAAVMNLSKTYYDDSKKDVTEQNEQIKCGKDVGMEIVIIDNKYQICNSTSDQTDMASLNVMVINTGTIDILDAQVRMVGTNSIIANNSVFNSTLATGSTVQLNITYDPEILGQFRQVRIVPRINLPGIKEHAFCSDVGIEAQEVPNNCTTFS